jgi:TolB-like protein
MKYVLRFVVITCLITSVSGSLWAKEKKKVAVLPFAIHSAENIDYVKQGVRDMLSSRISVSDGIEVIGKDAVAEAMKEKGAKDLTLADVYDLGKKMNVDFVVWGSITKIGNSLSIDGKLVDIVTYKSDVSIFTQSQSLDDVIPKINDFAQRIDQHILGTVPPTFSSPAVSSQLPVQQQPSPPSREKDIASGIRSSKKGTFTSIINPEFINAARPLDRKGFWMSPKIPTDFKGMDIGDVNGDGLNEIVLIDNNTVMIYQLKGKDWKFIHKIPGKSSDSYLAVDVADINQNGIKEIIVTNLAGDTLESFALEFKEGNYVVIASKLPWFLRVVEMESGTRLLGQYRGMDKPFDTPIHEIVWENDHYRQGMRMKIPVGLSVYGLTFTSLGMGGNEKIIALDSDDHIAIYEQTEKPLMKIQTFGGSNELLWKSDEVYGGSNTYIENKHTVAEPYEIKTFINLRLLTYDINKDGKKEIIAVKNISSVGNIFKNVKAFTSSEVYDLDWDGLGLTENWKTRKINGYVADYQFKDVDNDGQNEIVLALILSTGASISEKSVIVAYKLTPQQE